MTITEAGPIVFTNDACDEDCPIGDFGVTLSDEASATIRALPEHLQQPVVNAMSDIMHVGLSLSRGLARVAANGGEEALSTATCEIINGLYHVARDAMLPPAMDPSLVLALSLLLAGLPSNEAGSQLTPPMPFGMQPFFTGG
jgi:hypothetical protein